ncbi:hypothetical protein [Glutamicibacter halophytocola]|uniref:hypothetical protein n=1 Tax=Glutamicibacter halophytocola TaxID=1933880 RepID=UPI001892BED9|nr:hypothetical protein [Glutamicibacter halophytocola]
MQPIEAKVAQVISERDLAINRGSSAGVEVGMRFKILSSEPAEIRDPDTDEVLGKVEISKVEVEVVSVQPTLAVCRTFKKIVLPGKPKRTGIASPYSSLRESIFGDIGTPDKERYQTLRSDESFVVNELDPNGSFVKRGDRAIQLV